MAHGQRRIETMYAYVALDPIDNTEGVVSATLGNGQHYPLVGADIEMAQMLRPIAVMTANRAGMTIRLLHFTTREEVEVIQPQREEQGT